MKKKPKLDIPLDQSVALVRACQKLNIDTADQLFKKMNQLIAEIHVERSRRITAEYYCGRIIFLPHTSNLKTAKHFARLGRKRSTTQK